MQVFWDLFYIYKEWKRCGFMLWYTALTVSQGFAIWINTFGVEITFHIIVVWISDVLKSRFPVKYEIMLFNFSSWSIINRNLIFKFTQTSFQHSSPCLFTFYQIISVTRICVFYTLFLTSFIFLSSVTPFPCFSPNHAVLFVRFSTGFPSPPPLSSSAPFPFALRLSTQLITQLRSLTTQLISRRSP